MLYWVYDKDYIGVILGIYWGCIVIMEKEMEATIVFRVEGLAFRVWGFMDSGPFDSPSFLLSRPVSPLNSMYARSPEA